MQKLKQQQEEYGVYEVSDDDDDAAEFRYMSEWVTSNNDDLKRLCFTIDAVNVTLYCNGCEKFMALNTVKLRHAYKHINKRLLCVHGGCTDTFERSTDMWSHYIQCHKLIIAAEFVCHLCKHNPFTVAVTDAHATHTASSGS